MPVEVESIYELISHGDLPAKLTDYSDPDWFSVGLSLGPGFGHAKVLKVDRVKSRSTSNRSLGPLLRLSAALEAKSRELRIPLVASNTLGRFGPVLAKRGYQPLTPGRKPEERQTWLLDPTASQEVTTEEQAVSSNWWSLRKLTLLTVMASIVVIALAVLMGR